MPTETLNLVTRFKDRGANRGIGNLNSSMSNLSGGVGNANAAFASFGNTLVNIGINIVSNVIRMIGNLIRKMIDLAKNVAAVGVAITTYIGREAVNAFADFEYQIAKSASIAAKTLPVFHELSEELSDIALDLSTASFKTATEIAEGMYAITSAGYDSADAIEEMTKKSIAFSEAFDASVLESTELILAMKNTFGENTQAAEIMGQAIQSSRMTVDRLGVSLPIAATYADQLGVSMGDLTAALSLVVDKGIPASTAGTQLRMAFSRLIDPTKEGVEALNKYGLTLNDLSFETYGFMGVLENLNRAQMEMADLQKLVGIRAASTLNVLADNADAYDEMRKKMAGANSVAEIQERIMDTVQGQWQAFIGDIQKAYIMIGKNMNPALREGIQNLRDWIQEFTDSEQLVRVADALGDAFLEITEIIDKYITAENIESFITAFTGFVRFVIANAKTVIDFVSNLMKLLNAKNVEGVSKAIEKEIDEAIDRLTDNFIAKLKTIWQPVFDTMVNVFKAYVPEIVDVFKSIGKHIIQSIFGDGSSEIIDTLKVIHNIIKANVAVFIELGKAFAAVLPYLLEAVNKFAQFAQAHPKIVAIGIQLMIIGQALRMIGGFIKPIIFGFIAMSKHVYNFIYAIKEGYTVLQSLAFAIGKVIEGGGKLGGFTAKSIKPIKDALTILKGSKIANFIAKLAKITLWVTIIVESIKLVLFYIDLVKDILSQNLTIVESIAYAFRAMYENLANNWIYDFITWPLKIADWVLNKIIDGFEHLFGLEAPKWLDILLGRDEEVAVKATGKGAKEAVKKATDTQNRKIEETTKAVTEQTQKVTGEIKRQTDILKPKSVTKQAARLPLNNQGLDTWTKLSRAKWAVGAKYRSGQFTAKEAGVEMRKLRVPTAMLNSSGAKAKATGGYRAGSSGPIIVNINGYSGDDVEQKVEQGVRRGMRGARR